MPKRCALAAQPHQAWLCLSFLPKGLASATCFPPPTWLYTLTVEQQGTRRVQLFLEYRHGGSEPADVTFNLKDFKAMLSLCEGLNANVSVSFEAPGSPVVVKPHVARQQVDSPACITA